MIAWRPRRFRAGLAGGVIGFLAVIAAAPARPSRDGLPLGFSGGFGEADCTSCHFEAEVNSAAGSLSLSGVPVAYEPGETYRVQLVLTHPGVVIGGFEMTARFEAGALRQGGCPSYLRTEGHIAVGLSYQVQYVHHLRLGTTAVVQDTARWTVLWTAPSKPEGGRC